MQLPHVPDEATFDALKADVDRHRPVLEAAVEACGLDAGSLLVIPEGSTLVGAVGDIVVKVFAPFDRVLAETEARVLAHLEGKLPCPTPRLVDTVDLEDWPVVVMSRLEGAPLSVVWSDLGQATREQLCRDLGEVAATLHALDITPVEDITPEWWTFIADQKRGAAARQRSLGLAEGWVEQIDPYLEATPLRRDPVGLLHTELMREHIFVAPEAAGGWRITGLLDFEPAMVGAVDYELASVGIFVTRGDPALWRAYLDGSGVPGPERGEALSRRALAAALLHRYAHLPWYLRELGAGDAETLESLATRWWPHE